MRRAVTAFALLLAGALLAAAAVLIYVVAAGVSAREQPGSTETALARRIRGLAIARRAGSLRNPLPATADAVADGRAHFADHCAVCHGNDGGGETETGRGLWPRPPDMRQPATQTLSDGELFFIIEHGVRLTGMPAFGTGTPESEDASWRLVHFIRHLPAITPDEVEQMEALNPKTAEEWRQEMETERFLSGGDPSEAPSAPDHSHP